MMRQSDPRTSVETISFLPDIAQPRAKTGCRFLERSCRVCLGEDWFAAAWRCSVGILAWANQPFFCSWRGSLRPRVRGWQSKCTGRPALSAESLERNSSTRNYSLCSLMLIVGIRPLFGRAWKSSAVRLTRAVGDAAFRSPPGP